MFGANLLTDRHHTFNINTICTPMRYLTLDQIKKHLNIDSDFTEDDSYLESLEIVAVELIQKHIDHSLTLLEVDGQLPLSLQQGILLCIGNFYNNRESVAYASTHEIPSNLQWILDLYQYYDSTTESGGDSDIEKKITELEDKIKELVKAIESKADQSSIDTLTTAITTLSSDVSALSNTVSTKLDTTTFTDYQTTVDTKFDNIEKEISKAGKIDDVQVNGQSVVEDKVAKIDLSSYATSDTISALDTRISNNETAINQANKQITSLGDQVYSCENEVKTIGNAVSSKLDQTIYYSDKKEIESKISTNASAISTLDTTVDNLKASIPTKTSQLTNDSNYYSPGQTLKVVNSSIDMYDSTGSYMTLCDYDDDNTLRILDGLFYYPSDGNPYIDQDIDINTGCILSFVDSNICLYSISDETTLNIYNTGIVLSDGTAKQLYSADGKTYDITSLESKVSTNATNITSLESKVSTNTSAISTINTTIGNIDTLLITILNG